MLDGIAESSQVFGEVFCSGFDTSLIGSVVVSISGSPEIVVSDPDPCQLVDKLNS